MADASPKPSALEVARLRAAHQLLDRPLILDDPVAVSILGPDEEAALRADPERYDAPYLRGLRASLVARSRLAADEWSAAKKRGVRQYAVLGAGLDTSAYRAPEPPGCMIYEADLPDMQAWKRGMLRAAGVDAPPWVAYAPADFERQPLAEILAGAGFNWGEPALVSWLGVTMYLEPETVLGVLRNLAALPAGSAVAFDYAVEPARLTDRERRGLELVSAHTARRGEPWKAFFAPEALAAELRGMGYAEVEDLGPEEVNARYFQGRADGLRKSGVTRLACARR